jgi:hypothetical protein
MMKTKLVVCLTLTFAFILAAYAGSATWNLNPATGDWNTATNWTSPLGTVFTLINNTSATPIAGAFGNLQEGSKIGINNHNYLATYQGGDGNDLTLTVVP